MLKFASTTISDGDQRVASEGGGDVSFFFFFFFSLSLSFVFLPCALLVYLHLFTSNSHCNILPLAFRKVSLNGENRSTRSTADRWMDAQDVCSQSNKS